MVEAGGVGIFGFVEKHVSYRKIDSPKTHDTTKLRLTGTYLEREILHLLDEILGHHRLDLFRKRRQLSHKQVKKIPYWMLVSSMVE